MRNGDTVEVAGPHVISETIDGESVVIHLESGVYFSFDGTASEMWEAIVQGTSSSSLVAQLCARYRGAPEAVARAVGAFLDELEGDGLIRRRPGPPAHPVPAVSDRMDRRPPFAPPTVQRFTDIQELLMLDPIHEVDPAGWPRRGPDA